MSEDVVIVGAARTPIGAFNGGLSSVPASYLGQVTIEAALERAGVEASDVDEVVMGQILSAGGGQNPARQAAMGAGVPADKIRQAARIYANAERGAIYWGMGISQSTHGTDNTLALVNLAMMCGHVGKAGTGLNPLRAEQRTGLL